MCHKAAQGREQMQPINYSRGAPRGCTREGMGGTEGPGAQQPGESGWAMPGTPGALQGQSWGLPQG